MKSDSKTEYEEQDLNKDPLSGAHGAHPVGVGAGATAGGLAGGAIGAVGGPIGAAVGIAAGAIAGGYAGKGVAEYVDPTVEETYWKENYASRPYVESGESYDLYQPAYRTGYEGRALYQDRTFDESEADLRRNYETYTASKGLEWDRAKNASRDAWDRVESNRPSDAGDERL